MWVNKINGDKGYVIVISLAIATILLLLLGVFTGYIITERKNIDRSYRSSQALNIAEAGVERAIWELNNTRAGESWTSNDIPVSVDTQVIGKYDITVSSSGNITTIQATGYVPQMQIVYQVKRKVKVKLLKEAGENTVFDMALFGGADTGRSITITGNTRVDSYNSEGQGKTYPNGKGKKGHIGTNSKSTSPEAVRITGNSEVDGTIYIGPGGDVDDAITLSGNVDLNGEPPKATLDTLRTLPEVTPPDIPPGLEYRGSLNTSGNSDYHISGNGHYTSISSSGNGDLIFDSDVSFIYVDGNFQRTGNGDIVVNSDMVLYIGGDFKFTGNGQLRIEGAHTLKVYVGGDITGTGNGIINTSQDPTKVLIFGLDTCSEVKITGNADLYGAVYARNAEVKVTGNGDVYGSLVGNKIRISGNSDVHYDEALAYSQNVPDAPTYNVRYVLQSWSER